MNRLHNWMSKGKMFLQTYKKDPNMELDSKKLFKDKRVVEEINRHKWLESEIAGFDIGFDQAAQDWLENYAQSWVAYHDPQLKHFGKPAMPKNTKCK